jgi:hypothetical protein
VALLFAAAPRCAAAARMSLTAEEDAAADNAVLLIT